MKILITEEQLLILREQVSGSAVNKNDLDGLINSATSNPNLAKFMKMQIKMEGKWMPGFLNYDINNPANQLPDAASKKIDPNLIVTKRSKYAKFSTPELGFKAYADKIIRWANGKMPITSGNQELLEKDNMGKRWVKGEKPTVAQFIYTWAPPNENDSKSYVNNILKAFPNETKDSLMVDLIGS